MGMFDCIVCKYPLPLPEDTKGFHPYGFQTKDFDNALDCYEIHEDGTLWLRECEREYINGNPNGKTFSEKFGTIKETKVWWTPIKPTKSINMYTYQHGEGQYDYWVEFTIVFINGLVDKIELKKFQVNDNTERKKQDAKRRKEHRIWYAFSKTRRYKYFVCPYNKAVSKISKYFQKFLYHSVEVVSKIERRLSF